MSVSISARSILIILRSDRRPGEGSSDPIWSEKQVAQCTAEQISDPPPRQMIRTVVDQVAALTKTAQVAQPIVGRIMIEVRSGKHNMRCPHLSDLLQVRPTSDASAPVAPRLPYLIVPSPVRQAAYSGPMRPAATLAHTAGPLETHAPAELAPMSWIQFAEFSTDRHASRDIEQWDSKCYRYCIGTLNWELSMAVPPFIYFDESHHHRNRPDANKPRAAGEAAGDRPDGNPGARDGEADLM
jgi:hypothetical protein